MSLEQVLRMSSELRLGGFVQSLERRIAEAESAQLPIGDFMRLLLEDEKLYRKEHTARRLITRARFRHNYDLEDFDMSFDRGISRGQLKELSLLSFLHNMENLLLLGKTGGGKSHLAVALGRRMCAEGIATSFFSSNIFFEEVTASKASGNYLSFLKRIAQCKAIILDDFGLRSYTHEEATVLMDILEERYRKGIVIVTSQVKPSGWKGLFEDPVIAEAIIDRLKNPSTEFVVLAEPSYRERVGRKKEKVVKTKQEQ